MSGYGKIESSFWTEEPTRRLDGRPRELAFFFRTSHHRNLIGAMRLPTGYIEGDLGWPREAVEHAIGVLSGMGYIVRDDNGWTHIPAQLTNDPPTVRNHWQAALTLAKAIPKTSPVFGSVVRQLHAMGNKHPDAWAWLTDAMAMLSAGDADAMPQGAAVASPSHANGPPHGTGEPSALHGDAKDNGIVIPAPAPAPAPPLPPVGGGAREAGASPKASKPGGSRKRLPLPKDWAPNENQIAYARELGLTGEPLQVTVGQFRWYWTEGDGKGEARDAKGWDRTWFTWAAKDARRNATGGGRGRRVDPAEQERSDSLGVMRGLRLDGARDQPDEHSGRQGGAAAGGDTVDHRGAAAGEHRTDGGRDPQAGVVVPVAEHPAEQCGDAHRSLRTGAEAPASGPADPGVRGDQEEPYLGQSPASAEGDSRDGERRVSAQGENQERPVLGQPSPGGERTAGDTGAAGGEHQEGGRAAGQLAIDPSRVGPDGEDLLDIPAFLRRTDAPVQVH